MAIGKNDPKQIEALRKQLESLRKSVQQQSQAAKPLAALVVTPGKLPAADADLDDELPDLTPGME
jgi:hypothetical protein